MRSRCLASCVALAAVCTATTAPAAEREQVVMIVHRATNLGPGDATDAQAHVILPADNRYQRVTELTILPAPSAETTDTEGQRVVTVPLGPIPVGESRAVRVLAWVHLRRAEIDVTRIGRKLEPLPEGVRTACLTDDPRLRLERVRPTASQAAGDAASDVARARKLYEHLVEHAKYDIDEADDLPDAVLAGEPASCSELAGTYLAMCRSVGIPARLVTAYVNREPREPSTDWQGHKWVEFFAEGHGWVPVDPTNRLNYPTEDFFGKQKEEYLTVVDDCVALKDVPDPAFHTVWITAQPAAAALNVRYSSSWRVSNRRADERKFFEEGVKLLADADPQAREATARRWGGRGQVLGTPFLLELLFDPAENVRLAAAKAIGDSGDVSVMLPLMTRHEDEESDAVKKALIDAARSLLDNADAEHRAKAVGGLAKSRTDAALDLLKDIWLDESRDVRKMAAQMLYKFGDKPAVHANYRQLVRDGDDFVRVLAALRWDRVPGNDALPWLVDLLESDHRWDRRQAFEIVKTHATQTYGYDPRKDDDDRDNHDAVERLRDWVDHRPPAGPQTTGSPIFNDDDAAPRRDEDDDDD